MKWLRGGLVASAVVLTMLLSACGSGAPQPQASTAPAHSDAPPPSPVKAAEMQIVALGDSLFAGYGLEPGQSYPARLETALRARGLNARIMNAGVSGDTTVGGLQRLDFTLNSLQKPPALVIISLGGNDMLRGLPPEQTRANLDAILAKLRDRKVPAVLMGMIAAPNLGADYAAKFNPIYPALAKKFGAGLVPFFLQPVVDKPALVQADHIHPTAAGIDLLVGATVDQVAKQLPDQK
ncbi:MAG: arylesterase [Proteobacteria bacterium]|nr:arylesterase [Pseudomonadota bacterium]